MLQVAYKRETFHVIKTPTLTATIERIQKGIPISEFYGLTSCLGLTTEDFARKVGISAATLSRRRRTKTPLDPEHSDRLLRFQRLFEKAVEMFDGNEESARAWLKSPARAFNFETPLAIAETEAGAREVENLIGRLEYGVLT